MSGSIITIKVLLFGPARSAMGVESLVLELPAGATVDAVKSRLCDESSALAALLDSCRLAVNQQFAEDDTTVCDGDDIAVIPPVSGGCGTDRIELVDSPIDAESLRRFVMSRGDEPFGGVCIFEGCTRAETDPQRGRLLRLEYEAYDTMAIGQMRSLADQAHRRWPIVALAMVHRTGAVEIGQPSVVIAVSCAHRVEAFESCRWLIDALKRDVPIWKREVWESGESSWVDPTQEQSS